MHAGSLGDLGDDVLPLAGRAVAQVASNIGPGTSGGGVCRLAISAFTRSRSWYSCSRLSLASGIPDVVACTRENSQAVRQRAAGRPAHASNSSPLSPGRVPSSMIICREAAVSGGSMTAQAATAGCVARRSPSGGVHVSRPHLRMSARFRSSAQRQERRIQCYLWEKRPAIVRGCDQEFGDK